VERLGRIGACFDESLAALDLELSPEVKAACDEVHAKYPYPMG